jgi:hypothetical protein
VPALLAHQKCLASPPAEDPSSSCTRKAAWTRRARRGGGRSWASGGGRRAGARRGRVDTAGKRSGTAGTPRLVDPVPRRPRLVWIVLVNPSPAAFARTPLTSHFQAYLARSATSPSQDVLEGGALACPRARHGARARPRGPRCCVRLHLFLLPVPARPPPPLRALASPCT